MLQTETLTILNALGESVFILDSERQILFANPSAEQRFGKNLAGHDFVHAIRHPDCLQAIRDVLDGAAHARAEATIETQIRATYEISVTRLAGEREGEPSVAVCLNDISTIREAEQMRSDFVANVSHELRSPLTAVAGMIETLLGPAREDHAARERFLALMQSETTRMTRLIADLLSLSRVEAISRTRPAGAINLAALAERVRSALEPVAQSENKTLLLETDPDLPSIPGDEDELTQLLHNLIENALKYGAPGTEVRIRVQRRGEVAGIRGPAVAIDVEDRGEGIPPEHVPRLTERFYRVDQGRSRNKGGTGLGLAIVKHIVRHHRGRLMIESRPGEGSVFTALLPENFPASP